METAYLAGLALGLALIVPIGAQNVFVVGQGLAVGWPRAGWAVVAAGSCDTLLILAGAAGVSGLLTGIPALRGALLLGGAAFLTYLGAVLAQHSNDRATGNRRRTHGPKRDPPHSARKPATVRPST